MGVEQALAGNFLPHPFIYSGTGLGLRWEFLDDVVDNIKELSKVVPFFEISPENYMRRGGYFPNALERVREKIPLLAHGLTLSIGGGEPISSDFLRDLKQFLDRFQIPFFSDHLSFSSANGKVVHELLPIPHTRKMVHWIADRAKRVQDALERPLLLENITRYAVWSESTMQEAEFINEVLEASNAYFLLDVNNVYVNAMNDGFDPIGFLEALALARVREIHIAGHEFRASEKKIIDTHGANIVDPVYQLLDWVIRRVPENVAIVLERDHNVPVLEELLREKELIQHVVKTARETIHRNEQNATNHCVHKPLLLNQFCEVPTEEIALQQHLVEQILHSESLGMFDVYMRLSQSEMKRAICKQMPRSMARLENNSEKYFTDFFQRKASESRYLRDVSSEFLQYMKLNGADDKIPKYWFDLATHELVAFEVASALDDNPKQNNLDWNLEGGVQFSNAVRIVAYEYAVHQLSSDAQDRSIPEKCPTRLLVYRDADYEVRYLELSETAFHVTRFLLEGQTLRQAITSAAATLSLTFSHEMLHQTGQMLLDLVERGAVVGTCLN